MSHIRGRGNKETELALRKLLKQHGIKGWRRHQDIFGKPDFVFRVEQLAVFVDGCFWHGCNRHYNIPKTNRAFWRIKLETNKTRDRKVNRYLRKNGWRVIRIWEHELSSPGRALARIKKYRQNEIKVC